MQLPAPRCIVIEMRCWFGVAVFVFGCNGSTQPAPAPPILSPGPPPGAAPAAPANPVPFPAGTGDIGAAGPTLPLAIARDGGWVALCQARADTDGVPGIEVTSGYHGELGGDAMLPYFIRGGGLGVQIEQLITVSDDTKRVAFTRKGALEIFDAATGTTVALPDADLRGRRALGGPSTLSFSADGRLAVYFRPRGEGASVIVRDLTAGTEREVVLPKGTPWAVEPDPTGPWARLYALVDDTDGDGKVTPPQVRTNRAHDTACTGPAVSYSTYGMTGDRPKEMWLRLDTGQVISNENLLRPIGDKMLTRAGDGAIYVDKELVIPSDCKAAVTGVLVDPLRVLAACDGPARELPVESFGKGVRLKTPAIRNGADRGPIDILTSPFHCTPRDGCFDARDGAVVDLHDKDYRSRRGDVLLLTKDEGFAILDLSTNAYRAFDKTEVNGFGERHILAGDALVELATGKTIGKLPAELFAIDDTGRGLQPAKLAPGSMPVGPLRWVSPIGE